MPKVSVIIPTYNRAKYLPEAIDSVLNQTYKDFEIILVDDGSDDNTKEILSPYIENNRIRYLSQNNKGTSAAKNKGIKEAKGEYVAFLDSDDVWLPDKLEKQVAFMEHSRDIGLLYSDCEEFNGNSIIGRSFKPVSGWIFDSLIERNPISTSTVMVKREIFDNCGTFDISLHSREDFDLWLRIAYRYKVDFINKVLARRRLHETNLCKNTFLGEQCRPKVYEKALRAFKQLPKITIKRIKRQLGLHYWDLGWHYFSIGEMGNARKYLLMSFYYQKRIKQVVYYLSTYLPKRLICCVRQVKHNARNITQSAKEQALKNKSRCDSTSQDKVANESRDIIYFCAGSLEDKLWINTHRVGMELAKNNRVLFIETPVRSYLSIFKARNYLQLKQRLQGLYVKTDNLVIYKPLSIIPIFLQRGIIKELEKFLFRRAMCWNINRIIKKMGYTSPIVWLYYIEDHHYYIGKFKERMVVYDCVDNIDTFPRFSKPIQKRRIQEIERTVLKKSDIVFAITKKLVEEKRKLNPNVYYAPNVADFAHFNKVANNNLPIPSDIAEIRKPIIGYIGALHNYRIDFSLINFIANTHPEWSIVLIGPCNEKEKAFLPKLKNIYYFGLKDYQLLPNYIKAFDVCILPYILNEHISYAFPLKFWEFMATGKPIVANYLPVLEEFEHLVCLTRTKEEFSKAIEEKLNNDTEGYKNTRILAAKGNTWEKRIDSMLRIINGHYLGNNLI